MTEKTNPQEDEAKLDELATYLMKGGTIQDAYGIGEDELEAMFAGAYHYLEQEKWQEAADSYLFLTFLNPYQARFWVGLGESRRQNKDYEMALDAYKMASISDHDDPRPYFHAAGCYIGMNDMDSAQAQLKLAIEHAEGKQEYAAVKDASHDLLDTISS